MNSGPFIDICSRRACGVSDDIICFIQTKDGFKGVGPVGSIRAIEVAKVHSMGNIEGGGVCR